MKSLARTLPLLVVVLAVIAQDVSPHRSDASPGITLTGAVTGSGSGSIVTSLSSSSLPLISYTFGGTDNSVVCGPTTVYLTPIGSPSANGATAEANAWQVFWQGGYFTNLWFSQNGNIGSGTNVTLTLRKNGSNTSLIGVANGNGGITTGFDFTHGAAITGGSNVIALSVTANNPSVSGPVRLNWSIQFVSYP